MAEPTVSSATEELIGAIRLRMAAERARVVGRMRGIDRELREMELQIRALAARPAHPRPGRRGRSY